MTWPTQNLLIFRTVLAAPTAALLALSVPPLAAAKTVGQPPAALIAPVAGSPREIVLFPFDDYSLPFNKGLQLTLVAGRKSAVNHGTGADPEHPNRPVLLPGKPGDPDYPRIYFYGTVIHINGEYRMWYIGDQGSNRLVCYAVSKDGVQWEKPRLGLAQYNGSKENNLVLIDDKEAIGGTVCLVLYEPEDPNPDRRFKMICEIDPTNILAAFSADGLRWKSSSNNPVIKGGTFEGCGLIRFNGCYYLNGQGGPILPPLPMPRKRWMVTRVSYDFEHWTQAGNISFRRDNIPPRPPSDFEKHRGEQVHAGASLWNRGNVIIGFYGQYHNETNDRRTCTIDLGLIVSNDAIHFKEPIPDFKIVPSYEEEDGAEPRLCQGQGFENIGDRTILWYGIWPEANLASPAGIRIATWPRDRLGYFSPSPRVEAAHCISSPLLLDHDGARLYVNADGLSDRSHLKIEILDERLLPLPGYSGEDCLPVKKSGLRQPVSWRGKDRLGKFAQPIRVRVNWEGSGRDPEDAQLYAVYID